jgi:hypothetical protein
MEACVDLYVCHVLRVERARSATAFAHPSSSLICPAASSRPIVAYTRSVFVTLCGLNMPASASACQHGHGWMKGREYDRLTIPRSHSRMRPANRNEAVLAPDPA